jgi:hypothetical protein
VAKAEESCGNGGDGSKAVLSVPIDHGLPLALVDARGRTALAFFTDGTRFAGCEFSWAEDGTVGSAFSWEGSLIVASGVSLDVLTAGLSPDDGSKATILFGHAGLGAVGVTISLASRGDVVASVKSGYYLAWWPSGDVVSSISSDDGHGHQLMHIDHPALRAAEATDGRAPGALEEGATIVP